MAELADALVLGASAFGRAGSNPALRSCRIATLPLYLDAVCGNSSAVEHCLAKAGVAGSNPVSRSNRLAGESPISRGGGIGRRKGLKIL